MSDFRLDKYEVTVGRFRAFVNAGMGTQVHPPAPGAGAHAKIPGSGWSSDWNLILAASTPALIARVDCGTWTATPGANENLPINCVSWYEAMAFCIWDGGYLPTSNEWNYAAVAGTEARAYPWSIPASSLLIDTDHASYSCKTGSPGCNSHGIRPVGSTPLGDGEWQQSDLAGNVSEWALDWNVGITSPCDDCAALVGRANDFKVARGGSFGDEANRVRVASPVFYDLLPTDHVGAMGVRCARAP